MLRKLARSPDARTTDGLLDDFGAEVRKIGRARIDWLNLPISSLKKSVKPKQQPTAHAKS
jgi:hypothetical protein